MLGEIALYSFIIVLLTGVFLTLFYKPSMTEVVYNGSYVPLKGIYMSEAYASTLDISFDVRGGLLIRQMHHWAALLFIAAMAGLVARADAEGDAVAGEILRELEQHGRLALGQAQNKVAGEHRGITVAMGCLQSDHTSH